MDKLLKEESKDQEESIRTNWIRNATLIDLSFIPNEIRERIINTYEDTKPASRQKLLNYFMEHKLKNLMDVIEEF